MLRKLLQMKLDWSDILIVTWMCMGVSAILVVLAIQFRLPALAGFLIVCIPVSVIVGLVAALVSAVMQVWRRHRERIEKEWYDATFDPLEQAPDRFHHLGDRGQLP